MFEKLAALFPSEEKGADKLDTLLAQRASVKATDEALRERVKQRKLRMILWFLLAVLIIASGILYELLRR